MWKLLKTKENCPCAIHHCWTEQKGASHHLPCSRLQSRLKRKLTQPHNLMPCTTAIIKDTKSSQQHLTLRWFSLFWRSIISGTCLFPLQVLMHSTRAAVVCQRSFAQTSLFSAANLKNSHIFEVFGRL